MTESEFQEFLITIGYRYNKKSHSAFNTFEGFHTIIEFSQIENRYSFFLDSNANSTKSLEESLKSFSAENKEFITKAVYKNKQIRITIKMTIDSEFDKEQLKNTAGYLLDLCKSETITPVCRVCSRNRKTGLYIVGRTLTPVCDNCIVRKRRQYEKRRDMFEKKKQNMTAGIFGALFGAALGASLYILSYQFFPCYGISGAVIAPLSFGGFVLTGKRATKLSAVICEIISFFAFLAAEYMAIIANIAVLIEKEGGGIAVSEAIEVTNDSLKDLSYLNTIILDIIIGSAIMIIIGIAYFLKRKYTRPLKISKNVL